MTTIKNLSGKIKQIPYIEELQQMENEYNIRIFLVGGTVRDLILDREISDLDIIAFGQDYEKVAEVFANKINATPIKFKDNVRIVKKGFSIDVSKTRGISLEEDLLKRDFTINNLAMSLKGDIFGDLTDILLRKIRAVSEESILDDPLRILRAFRFLSEFDFEITAETFDFIKKYREKLSGVASERVYAELKKTVLGEYFLKAFDYMKELEIFDIIIPELKDLKGKDRGIYHNHDPYEHTFCATRSTYDYGRQIGIEGEKLFLLFVSALLHDIGKGLPEYLETHGKYIGHETKGAKLACEILRRLTFSAKEIKFIKAMIENHTKIRRYAVNNAKDNTLKMFIFDYNELLDYLYVITIGDNSCKPIELNKILGTIDKIKSLRNDIDFEKSKLICGDDLIKLGLKPSENFKKILKDVKFKLSTGNLKGKDDAIKYITSNYKEAL
ncbi:HD domain-containing protein [Deferribacteraceae bacterium V6Fe1]|nr:HD domain-containing protein [Deferribacteraceae bacterium V6Fe1]